MQVNIGLRPIKKVILSPGELEMVTDGNGTEGKTHKSHAFADILIPQVVHTFYHDSCCSISKDVHSSLWDVESGSAGVSPSMTGLQRGEGEKRRC